MGKMVLRSSQIASDTPVDTEVVETVVRPVYKIKEVERVVEVPKVVEQETSVIKPVFTVKEAHESITRPVFTVNEEKHTIVKPVYSVREELHVFDDFNRKLHATLESTGKKIAEANSFYLEKMVLDEKVLEKLEENHKKLSLQTNILIALSLLAIIASFFN